MAVESQQYNNNLSDEISLKDLLLKISEWWRYLLSKWIIILVFITLGGVLGFWYAVTKKPIYTATTTFVLEDEKSGGGLGNLAGLASMAGVDLGSSGGIFQGDNILELYKSRKMVIQTLLSKAVIDGQSIYLIDRYIGFNELRNEWMQNPRMQNFDFKFDTETLLKPDRIRDSILITIANDISSNYLKVTKPDLKLSIISVDVKSKDEEFAFAFNEGIVKNVNDFYLQTKSKKSLHNINILQNKIDSVRQVMNGAIYSGVAASDATPNLNPTRQVKRAVPAQRAQFSAETNKAILSSLIQNLEMSKLSLLKETPLLEVIDNPILPLSKNKLGKVKGFLMGSFLFGFLVVFYLLVLKVIKNVIR